MDVERDEREAEARREGGDPEAVRRAIQEYMSHSGEAKTPDWKSKAAEEQRRRRDLERRLNELKEEHRRTRQQAEQSERFSVVRDALRELGVKKVDLAFRLVKDDIFRGEDGELYADTGGAQTPVDEYLKRFVAENPEFLPPRIAGGSGARGAEQSELSTAGFELERIRPGMSREETAQAWKEVARLAGLNLKSG